MRFAAGWAPAASQHKTTALRLMTGRGARRSSDSCVRYRYRLLDAQSKRDPARFAPSQTSVHPKRSVQHDVARLPRRTGGSRNHEALRIIMAAPPQIRVPLDLKSLGVHYDVAISPKESENDITARIDREKKETEHRLSVEMIETKHRQILDYVALTLICCTCLGCLFVILLKRPPDESSRTAWTELTTLVLAVAGYTVGRKAK
jgi:hypothetical protein